MANAMDEIFDVVDIRSGDFYFALHEEVITKL